MRKRFEVQYELGATAIERVKMPERSRDELPPVLRALQYIYSDPELNTAVFDLLESELFPSIERRRRGRLGMSLWEILVLGVVRLTLDANYDRLEHIANYDSLVRSLLGVSSFGENLKRYGLQTVKDNVGLLDEELIKKINELVVGAGHSLLKKNEENGLSVKVDSYVLESIVHFPTDINLLWDATRKCLTIIGDLIEGEDSFGWRKYKDWLRRIRNRYNEANRVMFRGGRNREVRLQKSVLSYLKLSRQLSGKIKSSKPDLAVLSNETAYKMLKYLELEYFAEMLDKHIDLVKRRIIFKEEIAHEEKVFSLFEPYTRWINKGKAGGRIELGLPVAIASDEYGFILEHYVMEHESDVDVAVPLGEGLLKWGRLKSLSFDKGFWSPDNYNRLCYRVGQLVMPKKGRLDQQEKQREGNKEFKRLRRRHAAVESDINALEHHGLNRCPDRGLAHFKRYAALGVLSLNLHRLGNILLEADRKSARLKQAA